MGEEGGLRGWISDLHDGCAILELAEKVRLEVIDAAIDYHDISVSNSTILSYLSPNNIGDFMACVGGILKFKPANPCPDLMNFHMKNLRLDLVNSWGSLGFFNHTTGAIVASELRGNWTASEVKVWLAGLLSWLFLTLDMMPGLIGILCFVSMS